MNQLEAIEVAKTWSWAKWVAMDEDGSWWAFKEMPACFGGKWDTPNCSHIACLYRQKTSDHTQTLAEVTP